VFLIFHGSIALFSVENSDHTIKAWMIEDGLPQNSVLALCQSRSGYLWLGTQLGLIRFNGLAFPVYNIWNTPGLKSNRITCIYEDSRERLWVGTAGGGLTVHEQDRWISYQTHEGLSSDHVNAIVEYPRGNLCVGTSRGLNTIRNGKIRTIRIGKRIDGAEIRTLAVDGKDHLWIGTDQGLFKKEGLREEDKTEPERILDTAVSALYPDLGGNLWIGTQKGIRLIANGQLTSPFSGQEILTRLPVTCLFQDRSEALWIGTYGEGLFRVNNGHITRYDTASGLSDDFIYAITQDNDLNLWIGTFTGGLVRLKPRIISNISRESGLPGSPVTAVLQDRDGFLWMGTRHQGIFQFKENRFIRSLSRKDGLLSDRILSLWESGNGDIWIGSESGGLNRITNNGIRSYTEEDGLLSDTVNAILQDQSGILWIATPRGLNTFINDTFKVREEFRGNEVKTLFEDQNGALWIGSQHGLSRIHHDRVRHFHTEKNPTTYEVFSIFESPHQPGVIWIGTNGTGLLRYEKDRFVQYTEKTGLHSNFIFSVTETRKKGAHYLWMSSFTGIFRVSLRSLTRFARNETDFITSTFFNEADGMINSECTGEGFPPVWKG
jgi:ligand-binding sensor domain-containing protein